MFRKVEVEVPQLELLESLGLEVAGMSGFEGAVRTVLLVRGRKFGNAVAQSRRHRTGG